MKKVCLVFSCLWLCFMSSQLSAQASLNCQATQVILDPWAGPTSIDPMDVYLSSNDVDLQTLLVNGQAADTFDCNDLGIQNVVLSGLDTLTGSMISCTTSVTVMDVTAPLTFCQNVAVYLNATGVATVSAAEIDAGSFDNCFIINLEIDGQFSKTYTCSNLGANPATLTATDAAFNSSNCMANVTVLDSLSPIAVCQNLQFNLDSNNQMITVDASFLDGGSSDNCSVDNFLINGQASQTYSIQDTGVNFATLTVLDASGNTSSCTAQINIGYASPNLSGTVVEDVDSNCTLTSGDLGLEQILIRFTRQADGLQYYTSTDSMGYYEVALDSGSYVAEIIYNSNHWTPCSNTQHIYFDGNSSVQNVDWFFEIDATCPSLQVDILSGNLRENISSYYYVQYENTGTADADSVCIDVMLDPFVNFLGSATPHDTLGNNTYRFYIGTVAANSSGYLYLSIIIDQAAFLGQIHCSEAHIYPQLACTAPIWNGAVLDAEAVCQSDTVLFSIINTSTVGMSASLNYYIYEDSSLISMGTYMLGANQSMQIPQAAVVGKSYRIVVEQEAGYPAVLGDPTTTVFIENCNSAPTNTISRGFALQFSNGNSSPFVGVDCAPNIASYDPNDKAAQPVGYGSAHYIEATTNLDYRIRFQNTGTDTAFDVYVLDTISPYLDLGTLDMGASSHNYTWSIVGGNVLRVDFPNIMLPDSNVNEPLSNGFFSYRIQQQPQNPIGTVIENTAAIYFDLNPPVITNTTFHTIGEEFVEVISSYEAVEAEVTQVLVYPNPFKDQLTFELKDGVIRDLELLLFDTQGRQIRSIRARRSQLLMQRSTLNSGLYFYQLQADGELIDSGKLIAH